jgi:ATP-dependent DNA helicase PIF1
MDYSQEQLIAFNKYVSGENIFITGPGGTGKTALIKYIQKDALRKGYNIQVCALTGCAAVLLDCKAKTLHSWAGIGLGNGSLERFVTKITKNSFLKSTWKNTDILVVDEVSMMSQKLFELLDSIGKIIRKSSKPFGGIQLIFSGDFYQLPPVGDKEDPETVKFCFESPEWTRTFQPINHIQLTKIFRQLDPVYQKILNQIREGKLRRSSNETLLHHVGREMPKDVAIRPTKLFPTRNKVDHINTTEMNKLITPEYEYKLKYHSDLDMTVTELMKRKQYTKEQIQTELLYLKGNLRCDEVVKIKIGCQVMCIVNIELDNGGMICNGSQGIVTRITESGLPVVKFRNSYEMTMNYHVWPSDNIPGIGVSQIPLILAWALTIHKAQGATLDIAEIDAGSGIFECGQTYVALSRVKSLEGLYLTSFDASRIKINRRVQEFYQNLDEINRNKEPVIIHEEKVEVEVLQIPIVVATPVENIPVAEIISDTRDPRISNGVRVIRLNEFELLEEEYEN